MKRHGNLWEKITSMENLRAAYRSARKGKTWQRAVQRCDINTEARLLRLQKMLVDKTFTTSEYKTRTIHEPKKRLIYRLPFYPDRIVQHALMNVLEPIWEGLFIHDSHACRKGKGIHSGSIKTMQHIRKYDYCLKCDISKFYPSIQHDTLFQIIKRKIKCSDTLSLIRDIVYSIGGGKNTPIGNYTSQWFGNLYMNELDQYVKHALKIKAYVRYCDDFLLFLNDKKRLNDCAEKIKTFLGDKLNLLLSKCSLFHVKQGVDFLGYRHFRKHILLRKSTTKRVIKRLAGLPMMVLRGIVTKDQARSSIASTMGWMKWACCHNLYTKLNLDQMKAQYA
jgi:retron-type reverse transcriptase